MQAKLPKFDKAPGIELLTMQFWQPLIFLAWPTVSWRKRTRSAGSEPAFAKSALTRAWARAAMAPCSQSCRHRRDRAATMRVGLALSVLLGMAAMVALVLHHDPSAIFGPDIEDWLGLVAVVLVRACTLVVAGLG